MLKNANNWSLFSTFFALRVTFWPLPFLIGEGTNNPNSQKGDGLSFTGPRQLNKQTRRYVPCIGVKIPSQVDSDLARTSRKGTSDKGDESESGLHPEGGDDRYKGIMILLRSHKPSVEAGLVTREPSNLMSAAG